MKSTLNVLEKLAVDLPSYVHEAKSLVPFPTWRQWLDFQTFKFFAEAAIKKGTNSLLLIITCHSKQKVKSGELCNLKTNGHVQESL